MSILIEHATVVADPVAAQFSTDWAVAVDGTEIAAVGPGNEIRQAYPDANRIDGTDCLLLPGLIDAHTHLYAALSPGMPSLGAPPVDFPQVLERVWWRLDKALNEQDILVSALVGGIASLKSGITTVLDHHASPTVVTDSLSVLAAGLEQIGLRACLAYEVSDRDGQASRNSGMAENRRFIVEARARPDALLRGLYGLHAVFSLSDETLQRCAGEAADLGVGCHMHMAEHEPELRRFAESHDQTIAEFLEATGILGPQTLLAHTVQVGSADIEVLKRTGTFNVHNPRSNMGNGVGIAPVNQMIALNQPVGLGSDGFYDIPQEMVLTGLLQRLNERNPSAFPDSHTIQMAYGHNARFAERVFGCRLGRIVPGYAADLALVRYNPPTPIRQHNLTYHIVTALGGGRVATVLVNGRVVLRDGSVLGVDEAEVLGRARQQASQLWARL